MNANKYVTFDSIKIKFVQCLKLSAELNSKKKIRACEFTSKIYFAKVEEKFQEVFLII